MFYTSSSLVLIEPQSDEETKFRSVPQTMWMEMTIAMLLLCLVASYPMNLYTVIHVIQVYPSESQQPLEYSTFHSQVSLSTRPDQSHFIELLANSSSNNGEVNR